MRRPVGTVLGIACANDGVNYVIPRDVFNVMHQEFNSMVHVFAISILSMSNHHIAYIFFTYLLGVTAAHNNLYFRSKSWCYYLLWRCPYKCIFHLTYCCVCLILSTSIWFTCNFDVFVLFFLLSPNLLAILIGLIWYQLPLPIFAQDYKVGLFLTWWGLMHFVRVVMWAKNDDTKNCGEGERNDHVENVSFFNRVDQFMYCEISCVYFL